MDTGFQAKAHQSARKVRLPLIATLLCWVAAALVGLILYYSKTLTGREYVIFAFAFLSLSVGAWRLLAAPLSRLATDRICKANEWWAGFDYPNQIELIRRGDRTAYVRFVRFRAMCPICGSEVEVDDGGKAFGGRLIGRCIESPREHLFSFDRVTRSGYPLRRPPI